jgi:16S rRNA (guanine966-N2)-methyltransferase
MAGNEVRIIGGKWRGRKLVFPAQADLRPTLGRVRETLFNWLQGELQASRCLDLFAGSGALGFEALSRGATEVAFVDSSRRAVKCLQENAAKLDAAGVTVLCAEAASALRRLEGPWDIIFLDPPFQRFDAVRILEQIRTTDALAEGGLIYLEAPRRLTLDLAGFRLVKHSRAGETQFGLLASS